jgi:hypothetical protein
MMHAVYSMFLVYDIVNESRNVHGDKPSYRTQTFIERDGKYIAV